MNYRRISTVLYLQTGKKQVNKAASSGTEICTRQIGNAPVGVKVFSNPSDAKVKSVSQLKDSRSIFSTGRTVK